MIYQDKILTLITNEDADEGEDEEMEEELIDEGDGEEEEELE